MDVIKITFCHPKKLVDSETWVLKVLSVASFDMQQSMFKLVMKSNTCATMVKPLEMNPLTWLWHTLSTFRVLVCAFPEYFKLVEIAMVQMFGSVEDEQCFSYLVICKSKLRNRLVTNLGLVVRMFSQEIYPP